MHENKWIVLTGGAGFIGSCVLRDLNEKGFKNIIIADNLGHADKWKNLVGKKFLNVIHKNALFEWLKGKETYIGAIIHLGACSSTVETDANYLLENNYRYSVKLAEYALTAGHRFIYASSAATYGDGSLGFSDDHEQLESLQPLNMYGFSKHLFDLWLKEENLLAKVVGLKYFNVFGPNEFHKGRMASALIKMVPDALKLGKISLFKSTDPQKFADGGQKRDFLYVKDAAKMTTQFLSNETFGIFNVGSGNAETWKAVASGVSKAVDRTVDIEFIDMPKDLVGKYQNYTCADMAKTKKHALMMPQFSLEAAVIDYVRNFLVPQKYW